MDEDHAIWALANIKGIGLARLKALIDRFGNALTVFDQPMENLTKIDGINDRGARLILKPKDRDLIEKSFSNQQPENSKFVAISDPNYPERLKNLSDPPPYFYYRGDLSILSNPCLAVVGSRKPTEYGERVTRGIVGELAAAGITIVSGLAYGIDSIAHQETLRAGGKTAAVLGNSLETYYPPGNKNLAETISRRGCIISEFPKGTKPEKFNFPVRNRVISGLCEGVLVIEAREKSGALITADHALDQGRDVMAVPGNIDNAMSDGPNKLLRMGAIPVSSAKDIFENFKWHAPSGDRSAPKEKPKLSGEEEIIYKHLSVKPVHLDELTRKAGLGPGKTAEVLLNLELKGIIIRKPGNYLALA